MKRLILKIGDIFEVKTSGNQKKFFQYIANDITMLNSSVIRAFKKIYPDNASLNLEEVINDDVDFYAHVFLRNRLDIGTNQATFKELANLTHSLETVMIMAGHKLRCLKIGVYGK
jgi:hypothetical protein